MRQRLLAAVAIVLVASSLHAQPSTSAAASLDLAFAHLERLESAGAEKMFTALLGRSDLSARQRAKALRGLGVSIFVQNRPREAAGPFGQALEAARLAHFATHAIVRGDDPLGSYLMLGTSSRGGEASERDGRLTASEVAGLSLSADLVVLGACRSARGPVSSDGIAGLTRAFLTAGAPSLVATLWDVADQTTARVMTRFYAGYLAGVSKDRALRAAQLTLLHDLQAGRVRRTVGETTLTYAEHPHLWAGAILIGAP